MLLLHTDGWGEMEEVVLHFVLHSFPFALDWPAASAMMDTEVLNADMQS